ncbi:tetratricopeptide repeat protein [Opitutaceae bacterium TAV4]|nr:tetratricopeptide repeat protein [Opitutaceae bacterium TAV4]
MGRLIRWGWPWLAGLLLAVTLVSTHWLLVRHYLDRVTTLKLSEQSLEGLQLRGIVPPQAADGMTWTSEIIGMVSHGDFRLRTDYRENAPEGRPVYWSSGWAWLHIVWARIHQSMTGAAWPLAVERAAAWINLPLLLLTLAGFSLWMARRQGAVAGGLLALALVGAHTFYESFFPSNNDHHGIANIGLLALICGVLLGGVGFVRRKNIDALPGFLRLPDERVARRAFIVSGLGGGVALWVNAVAAAPAIGLIGAAGLLAALAAGRELRLQGAVCRPDLWRLWGRAGAAAGVFFFLLEQFPDRLFGLRLEVNHPVYALAWLGGAEGVALLLEWLGSSRDSMGGSASAAAKPWRRKRTYLAFAAVALAPALIVVCGERVFMMFDPFMARIHDYVIELRSLASVFGQPDVSNYFDQIVLRPVQLLLALLTLWIAWRRPAARLALVFSLAVALPMTVQGWWQTRWLQPASVPQSLAAVVMLCVWLEGSAATRRRRFVMLAVTATALFLITPVWLVSGAIRIVANEVVLQSDGPFLLHRDIAAALRRDRPKGPTEKIVLLTDPTASTPIGYFGGFSTLGTFHWENGEGLRAAAQLMTDLCVAGPDEWARAERLARERGVTHVAWISISDYMAGYWHALYPDRPLPKRDALGDGNTPAWLRPIPYAMPSGYYRREKELVRLYAVDFSQTEYEARYRAGQAAVAGGRLREAEFRYTQACDVAPDAPQPWMRLAELRLSAGDPVEAFAAVNEGIRRAPPERHRQLYSDASHFFRARGAIRQAERLLELAGQTASERNENKP